jgi:hypothetical protein
MTDNELKDRITIAEFNYGSGKRVIFRLPDGTVYRDAHPHVVTECKIVNGKVVREEILMIDLSKWDN